MAVSSQVFVQAYTELAPRYERNFDRELRACWGLGYDDLVEQLVSCIPFHTTRRVLDLATGTARIPLALAARAPVRTQIVGLDITPAMLRYGQSTADAQGLRDRIQFLCASAQVLPFGNESFDAVICALAWQYLDALQVLHEITRVLRPGGHMIMAAMDVPPAWKSGIAGGVLSVVTRLYGASQGGAARSATEASAVGNLRTATEWRQLLRRVGLTPGEPILQRAGRRFFYPGVLLLRATLDRS